MRVSYTDTALREVQDILSFIAKDNEEAAHQAALAILATIDRVAEFPRLTVDTNVAGVRVAPVLPYRYLIYFGVENKTLIVRNVRHSAQNREGFERAIS